MFTIECLDVRNNEPNLVIVCDRDTLYRLTDMLYDNNYIDQFKVSIGTTIYMPKDLGWNDKNKWVSKFTYD